MLKTPDRPLVGKQIFGSRPIVDPRSLLEPQRGGQVESTQVAALPDRRSSIPAPAVVEYYRQTIDDYRVWSRLGYMHFGLWRRWMNPFNRRTMLEAMNDLVFDALGLGEQGRGSYAIGDFGCGLAAVSKYGHQRYSDDRWHAFSICPEQVAEANRGGQAPNLDIRCADYRELPLADASLEGAFFLESLCHSESLAPALKESHRVLKPGGRLVVVDGMMRHRDGETPNYVKRLASAVSDCWAVPRFHSVVDFEWAALEAGFEIESRREIGMQVVPCVAHSPLLVACHSLSLILQGKWNRWKRRHMIGCGLGVLLGMMRHEFGYFVYSLRRVG